MSGSSSDLILKNNDTESMSHGTESMQDDESVKSEKEEEKIEIFYETNPPSGVSNECFQSDQLSETKDPKEVVVSINEYDDDEEEKQQQNNDDNKMENENNAQTTSDSQDTFLTRF